MLVAEEFVGTLDDEGVAERVASGDPLRLTVDETERRRSRFRTGADDDTDLGVLVARELCDGDVLSTGDRLVVVSLEPVEAMVLDFGAAADPDTAAVRTALELGHAVGNRHWDLAVGDQRAYLPLADTRERMEATVEPHLPEAVTIGYDEVPPTLFDEGDAADHAHGHDETDHAHGEAGHSHGHGVRTLDPKSREADGGADS